MVESFDNNILTLFPTGEVCFYKTLKNTSTSANFPRWPCKQCQELWLLLAKHSYFLYVLFHSFNFIVKQCDSIYLGGTQNARCFQQTREISQDATWRTSSPYQHTGNQRSCIPAVVFSYIRTKEENRPDNIEKLLKTVIVDNILLLSTH